ncbi:DeoR family fructose operon transcriptional repressor [Weissella uvarum]|uniref:DeoR/GlpR family DNA-binding transcription regulator n=1 Tax=Weissella uvarum TaxID=1479233 RepID=UPI00195F2584|nr:DeoR/GlpR family DNA-binding transcription regulator [Weissella uvarum]MBM7616923.1 DeoR family fructose operon transcriptional repressor [Weissella uvarum]MCM0594626.1 DeoR/GlpR transcriptional regulator [Weissella uvarum]
MIAERYDKILKLLKKRQRLSVNELADLLLVSKSTLRRDLAHLEANQQVRRIHGGVELVNDQPAVAEPTLLEKQGNNRVAKQAIAQQAVKLLQGGENIYLDAGTTTDAMIPLLADIRPSVTVVTNSVNHAAKLADLGIAVLMIGGRLKLTTNAIIGTDALSQIQQLTFDVSFLGINGVSLQQGYTTPDLEEAAMKRHVMQRSRQAIVLADTSKFKRDDFSKVADLSAAMLITNQATKGMLDIDEMARQTDLIITEDEQ